MLRQKFLAYTRLVIEAVQRSLGCDLDEIAVSLFVLGKHQQVIVSIAFRGGAVIVLFAYVKFTSDNRLDAMLVGGIHEVHGAKNITVVRHGHSRHAKPTYVFTEFFDVTSAIQKGIVGVQVQVDELGHGAKASLNQPYGGRDVESCEWLCI